MSWLRVSAFLACLVLASCRDHIRSTEEFKELSKTFSIIKDKGQQYHAIEKGLEDEIVAQLEVFQQWLLEGNPDLGIPVMDPWELPHLEYATSNDLITFNVALDGMHLTGLATFTILEIDVNLLLLKVGGTLNIPELHFWADHYYLDGLVSSILPLFGEGLVDLTVRNLNLTGSASLTTLNDQVGLKNVEVGLAFDSITGEIENILGSGMDDVVNDILNILGPDIFNSVSDLVSSDVALFIQTSVNEQLEGMTLDDLISSITGGFKDETVALLEEQRELEEEIQTKQGNANEYLDAILENVRSYLISNGYDNYTLPDMVQGFSDEWAGITWHGEATLTEGFLTGLQTIHRVEDAQLVVNGDDGSISIAGTIEFFDFAAGYHMHVGFMSLGIDAEAAVGITSVQVQLRARLIVVDPATKAFTVVIDELNITNPGLVSVEFSGLGALDFLLDGLGFIVGNVFGGLIFNAIEGPIQEAIINALGEVLPFAYL